MSSTTQMTAGYTFHGHRASQDLSKDSFLKRLKEDTKKNMKCKALAKGKNFPTIKITSSILQSATSRKMSEQFMKMEAK